MSRYASLIGYGKVDAEFVPVDRLIHPDAALAARFWDQRPADGIHIGRDIPSRNTARLLNRIAVCEPVAGGRDFLVHLCGGAINQRFRDDLKGKYASAIFKDPAELKIRLDAMNDALRYGVARMMRIFYRSGGVELMRHEAIVLPAVSRNGDSNWALVFAFYFQTPSNSAVER